MPVTITADQAVPGDIISDKDGNLWSRGDGSRGQVFFLVHVFTHVFDNLVPPGQDDIDAATLDLLAPLNLMLRDGKPVGDELPAEPAPPKTVEFTWYLHDSKPYEVRGEWSRQLGFTVTDELLEKMGQPFCEVMLRCSLDTETGKVEILEAK